MGDDTQGAIDDLHLNLYNVAVAARDGVRRLIEQHGVPLEGWGYDVEVTDAGDVYRVNVKLYPPPDWITINITVPPAGGGAE